MSTSVIHLYKASAGAGKTYTLAKEFIKLLIEEPFSYRRILAVTFTNKATEEMQRRIVKNLFSIANGLSDTSGMLKDILRELKCDEKTAVRNARLALFLILHDYNHFQISTIDSFFQIILRNLAKELGLGAYLNIVIDWTELLDEAVKLLINDLQTDAHLKVWLNSYSAEKDDDNKSWKIDQDIFRFGKNIFNEIFKLHQNELEKKLKDRGCLSQYRDELNKLLNVKKAELSNIVNKIDSEIDKSGFLFDTHFYYGKSGAYSFVNHIKKGLESGDFEKCNSLDQSARARKAVREDATSWAKKSDRQKELIAFASGTLNPLMEELEQKRAENTPIINTCQLILAHIYKIGILNNLSVKIRDLMESRNQFLLSDTPTLLNDMISDSDAPFIYEKIGTSLEHIMIDEFQDTSLTQWRNFKPLVKECLAQEKSNLIVGDAKQSIYRFRNGDWRIIEGLRNENGFPNGTVLPINLGKNWRSQWEVVNFNNSLFAPASDSSAVSPVLEVLRGEYGGHALFDELCDVYKSAYQECTKTEDPRGFVSLEFIPREKADGVSHEESEETPVDNLVLEKLREKVEELQDCGIPAKDIAILTRKGREIEEVADYFTQYKNEHPESKYVYTIISNEAFKLESSIALQMIMDALRVAVNPEDQISMAQLFVNYKKESLAPEERKDVSDTLGIVNWQENEEYLGLKNKVLSVANLPFYEMVETLCQLFQLHQIAGQESYLLFFFDNVNEYIKRKSPDIDRFIDYWNRFLKTKSIPFSDNVEGIRIMTIHKSKGLEFKTVIVPFCTWNLYGDGTNMNPTTLWCATKGLGAPFDKLPVVPVDHGKKMENSLFQNEYREERIQLLADAVNLLYVAFTRAEENLIIFAEKPKNEEINNCSDLMYALYKAKLTDDVIFTSGKLGVVDEKKRKNDEKNPFDPVVESCSLEFQSHEQKARFKQSNKAVELIEELNGEESQRDKAIQKGLLLHYLFSNIGTASDIERAADQLLFEGVIDDVQKTDLIAYAHEKIKKHEEWFSDGLTLYNERTILFKGLDGKAEKKRPDRVIQKGNEMIVIDFKTGKRSKKHTEQINEYVALLSKMGYDAKGYLWYLNED